MSATESSPSSPSKSGPDTMEYDLSQLEWSLERLKTAAIHLRLLRPRSLAWAILLQAVPAGHNNFVESMRTHRTFYNDLSTKLSMDPRAVLGDDPLSQKDESAWKQHFCDNELQALILQDVIRTFPEEPYFRDPKVQDLMVRVLFFWARSHSLGYRQGMHEILAPLLYELYADRKYAPSNISEPLKYYLEDAFLEHDSYMLFSAVMKGLEKFYTTGDVMLSSTGRLPPAREPHSPNEVVRYLERIREEYLIPQDPELAMHLDHCNITMELFGIRWVRLLFGRELPRSELPHLWGFVFADGPTLPYLHYVLVAMLIAMLRWVRLLFGRELPRSELPHLWGFVFADGPTLPYLHYVLVAMLIAMRNILLDPEPGAVLSALMRPCNVSAAHVCALALHLRKPAVYVRPQPPPVFNHIHHSESDTTTSTWTLEQLGSETGGGISNESGSEGVAEGADVARELAALALVRAQLPSAAAALARALPKPPPEIAQPLQQILQMAALLQCRNHALIDVETALEAAEGQNTDKVGRKKLVPISVIGGRRPQQRIPKKSTKVREVQLKVFAQGESSSSDLPSLDPLRIRTE